MEHIDVTDEWLYQNMPLVNEAMIRELEEHIKITVGLIDVYRYADGHVYCYLEYRENVFSLYADKLTNREIKEIFENWIYN